MKIEILGSGGGEGYPALFCECEHCKASRKAGGKSIRSLSQTLIDDKLLIDLPTDTLAHFRQSGACLGDVAHLLITHVHADHFCPTLLDTRGTDFAPVMAEEKLHVYGNADVKRLFDGYYDLFPIREEIRKNIVFSTLTPCESFAIGKYTIMPLKANHAYEQTALNYVIDDGKTALLYLLDSGYPLPETLGKIVHYGKKFDCVIMDATMGENYYIGHMNFAQNKQLKSELLSAGVADGHTRFIVAHITHNHCGLHEEIEEYFKGSGIEVAYDGLSLELKK